MGLVTRADLELLYEELIPDVYSCPGQLSFYDRLIYYWAGRHYFTGQGLIIDAGALIGSAALLLAHGIHKNARVNDHRGKILSYDLFEDDADGHMTNAIARFPTVKLPPPIAGKIDFEVLFRATTSQYSEMIQVRRGDIAAIGYQSGAPIEILSIDVGKSPELMRSVAIDFFPSLIAGHSILLHQDYMFPFQPWLHVAMELLSDFFVKEFDPPTETTVIHRLVKPITREDVESRLPIDYFTVDNLRLFDAAEAKATSAYNKVIVRSAQVHAYWLLGRQATARRVASEMMREHGMTASYVRETPVLVRLFEQMGMEIQ